MNKKTFILQKFEHFDLDISIVLFNDNTWGYMDQNKILISELKDAYFFDDIYSLALTQFKDGSWGYIDKLGNIVSKGFKEAYPFENGTALVIKQNGQIAYLHLNGDIIETDIKLENLKN